MVTTIISVFSILLFVGVALGLMRVWWIREEMRFELEETELLREARQAEVER